MSRGFGKIHTKKSILGKIQWRMRRGFGKMHIKQKAFWAKYNGECAEVSAKYIQKKKHSGQNTMENAWRFRQNTYQKKKAFWAKYNMRRGFGKIHTKKKIGQNTMENA